jgi:hypothetical protein
MQNSGFVARKIRGGWALGVAAALLANTSPAAAVTCDALALPNKLFGIGDSSITATLKRTALALANDSGGSPAERTTIFYSDLNACDGYAAFVSGHSAGTFKYWIEGSSSDQVCEARAEGQPLVFAHLPAALEYCRVDALPAGLGAFRAPAQSINLITGLSSTERVVSAEALYFIYGWGHSGQASPWTDGTAIFASEGLLRDLLGRAIGVPPARFYSDPRGGGGSLVNHIETYSGQVAAQASQAIAFVDGATSDVNRSRIKPLGYQHFGQSCGVWPDSTDSSFDKLNVRLGKYALWEQGLFLARVSEDGAPLDERVANFLGWFDGRARAPGATVDVLSEVIESGVVPDCAMQVERDGVLGALSSYAPPKPCGCRFEATATGASSCSVCSRDTDCDSAAPSCNFGFCEAYRDAALSEG